MAIPVRSEQQRHFSNWNSYLDFFLSGLSSIILATHREMLPPLLSFHINGGVLLSVGLWLCFELQTTAQRGHYTTTLCRYYARHLTLDTLDTWKFTVSLWYRYNATTWQINQIGSNKRSWFFWYDFLQSYNLRMASLPSRRKTNVSFSLQRLFRL